MQSFTLRKCRTCGAMFQPTGGNEQFCSVLCRFEAKVQRHASGTDDCDLWTAGTYSVGYGFFTSVKPYTKLPAHRVAWELANGPIPAGFQVGHACHDAAAHRNECAGGVLCQHRKCVRVGDGHLILQTPQENMASTPLTSVGKRICSQGHALEADNLALNSGYNGRGQCRKCRNDKSALRQRTMRKAAVLLGISYREFLEEYGHSVVVAREIINTFDAGVQ